MINKTICAAIALVGSAALLSLAIIALGVSEHLAFLINIQAATTIDILIVLVFWAALVGVVLFALYQKTKGE